MCAFMHMHLYMYMCMRLCVYAYVYVCIAVAAMDTLGTQQDFLVRMLRVLEPELSSPCTAGL